MRSLINLITRICQSRTVNRYANRYFRWPAARTLFIYACLAAFFTLTSTLEAVYRVTSHEGIGRGLEVGGINIVACAFLTAAFLFLWGVYYRLATGFFMGAAAFIRGIPNAWYRFRRGCSRLVSALQNFAYGVVDFFGRIGDFFGSVRDFCRDFPANWRRKSGKQKADVIINASILAIWAVCTAAIYPLAHRLSTASPHWMPMSDAPLLQTIFYDLVLGCFAMIGVCLVISLVLVGVQYAMRGRKA